MKKSTGRKPGRPRSTKTPQEKQYETKSAEHLAAEIETEGKRMLDLAKILREGPQK